MIRNMHLIASLAIIIVVKSSTPNYHHVAAFNGNTNHASISNHRTSNISRPQRHAITVDASATTTDGTTAVSAPLSREAGGSLIGPEDIRKISRGGVAILPNWLPPRLLASMRADVHQLFDDGQFRPDGLTNSALGSPGEQGFTSGADRQTFRGGAGWDSDAGDAAARAEFSDRMRRLRGELAAGLGRPTLAPEGELKHEMTYNWYEPGAKLGRHLDEHHEETKGPKGWMMPTRRSVTWLVYLNDGWRSEEGGKLRCFPRSDEAIGKSGGGAQVGAHEGNLQVGWLNEGRDPVFLDVFRESGGAALYQLASLSSNEGRRILSARDFDVPGQPIEFASFLKPELKESFTQISTSRKDPRFASASSTSGNSSSTANTSIINDDNDKVVLDIAPTAGTLVLFDSVSLPHLVREVTGKRQRIASTGWFHEDSQFTIEV